MPTQPEAFPGIFPGTIGAPPDIAALVAASDLVCLARITSIKRLGKTTYLVNGEPVLFDRVTASLQVERALTGLVVEPAELGLLELDQPSGLARLAEGEHAALFLVRRGDQYALADLVMAAIDLDRPDEDVRKALLDAQHSPDAEVARIATELLEALKP